MKSPIRRNLGTPFTSGLGLLVKRRKPGRESVTEAKILNFHPNFKTSIRRNFGILIGPWLGVSLLNATSFLKLGFFSGGISVSEI